MTSLTTQLNLTQVTWFGRLSVGNGFGGFTTWNIDARNEGEFFPDLELEYRTSRKQTAAVCALRLAHGWKNESAHSFPRVVH
jgi:hypothetical protein